MPDDPAPPTVVPIGRVSLADVPGRLRQLADEVERGDYGQVPAAVVVLELADDGATSAATFGFGASADVVRSAGLLHLGLGVLSHGE